MTNVMVFLVVGVVVTGMVFLHRQLAAIHELVNSNLTRVETDLAIAQRRIKTLESHIATEPE